MLGNDEQGPWEGITFPKTKENNGQISPFQPQFPVCEMELIMAQPLRIVVRMLHACV